MKHYFYIEKQQLLNMQKRGQVTAFILIGLLILLLVFGVVAVRQGYLNKALEKLGFARTAPMQVEPLQNFMESCVKQISLEGINLIGMQGGYTNLPEDKIPNSQFTPVEEVLNIIPGSELKTALWFRERGNGIQVLDIPSKARMENELADYVSLNFELCINNLTSFEEQGYILSGSGIPETEAIISDTKVRVTVDFPINVAKDEKEFSLEKHTAEIDSKLGELYKVAAEIMNAEYEQTFLENKTINLLVAYDSEIPFSGLDLSCTEKTWSKPETILKLKNVIFENIAAASIKKTSTNLKIDSLEYLQFDPLKNSHSDLDVNLMYIPEWPTLIEISPSEGNILRGNTLAKKAGGGAASLIASFVCISDHRFIYDIKYPVLITLRDPSGLIFQFATEVIIDNNQPRLNTLELPQTPDIENQICQYPQKEVTVVTATYNPEGELMPLTNVDLSFKCSPASCPLGVSSENINEPILKAKVPLCFNGLVEGNKEGYASGKSLYSSNEESGSEVLVALEPMYNKNVVVKVIDKSTGEIRGPYESEQISFQFAHKQLTYTINYNYPGQTEIPLVVGDYNINSYLTRKSTWPVTTKKQAIENCVDTRDPGLIGFFKTTQHCETIEIPSMEFENALTGGAVFENSFTRQELSSTNPLTLYVLSDQIPSDIDSMQNIQLALETNKDHPLFKYPEA